MYHLIILYTIFLKPSSELLMRIVVRVTTTELQYEKFLHLKHMTYNIIIILI